MREAVESIPKSGVWQCPKCLKTVPMAERYRYPNQACRLAKHCGCVVRAGQNMTDEEFAAHRRQKRNALKLKYRREAAAAKRVAVAERQAITQLHEAHVKRYDRILYDRKKALEAHRVNPGKGRARASKRRQSLNDSYVIQNLKQMGIPVAAITPSLIAMKNESMGYRRLSRITRSTIQQHLEKENEAITKHT